MRELTLKEERNIKEAIANSRLEGLPVENNFIEWFKDKIRQDIPIPIIIKMFTIKMRKALPSGRGWIALWRSHHKKYFALQIINAKLKS